MKGIKLHVRHMTEMGLILLVLGQGNEKVGDFIVLGSGTLKLISGSISRASVNNIYNFEYKISSAFF